MSDILETGDVPRRYYLSAKACRGILRRAEKRGKDLPAALHEALRSVAEAESPRPNSETKSQTPSSHPTEDGEESAAEQSQKLPPPSPAVAEE